MQVIPGITRCVEHGLLIKLNTTVCALCNYFWAVTPDLIEAFKIHEEHPPGMEHTIGPAFFDPREHCFVCRGHRGL